MEDERTVMPMDTANCALPEFVGTAVLDTIGLVLPSIDRTLLDHMPLPRQYPAIGSLSSRSGAAGQIVAVDDAVKATNTDVLSVMLPRDSKGWGGHGVHILLGSDSVADVRYAIQMALELTEKYAGEVYLNSAGHLEFAYSPSAGPAIQAAFHAPLGRAFGLMTGSPASIGLLISDLALKAASVDLVRYYDTDHGTSHTNEVIVTLSGDASDVKRSVLAARSAGLQLLSSLGETPRCVTTPFLTED